MSDRAAVREEVLRRANGRCERCLGELGDRHHFHFEWYPVFHADNLIVLCAACHGELLARRRSKQAPKQGADSWQGNLRHSVDGAGFVFSFCGSRR